MLGQEPRTWSLHTIRQYQPQVTELCHELELWAISVSSIALTVNHKLCVIAWLLLSWNTKCFLYLGIYSSSLQQASELLEGIYLCLSTMPSSYFKTYQLCLVFANAQHGKMKPLVKSSCIFRTFTSICLLCEHVTYHLNFIPSYQSVALIVALQFPPDD